MLRLGRARLQPLNEALFAQLQRLASGGWKGFAHLVGGGQQGALWRKLRSRSELCLSPDRETPHRSIMTPPQLRLALNTS